jgi:hypothetical protein
MATGAERAPVFHFRQAMDFRLMKQQPKQKKDASPHPRKLGSAKGEFIVPDDINKPLPRKIVDRFWK